MSSQAYQTAGWVANEALAPKTSVRIGGPAQWYHRPKSPKELVGSLKLAKQEGIPLAILGGGANTLVGDGGVKGLVLKLPPDLFVEEVVPDEAGGRVTIGAGASISRLVSLMKINRWVGAEFLAGIPGSLGGALAMNAGTKMGECLTIVEAIELCTPEGAGWISKDQLSFGYRKTDLPEGSVVSRVQFRLRTGDLAASSRQMEEDLAYRKRTQPLSQPSFGSVFRNPPQDHAGRLIEQVGLKGHRIGQAEISKLHGNWIVNLGKATAKDVTRLIDLAVDRVRSGTGIVLVPEVRTVGEFL